MSRILTCGVAIVLLCGCQLPPEQVPLKPLPEDGSAIPFADLVTRTRAQVDAAREAFYEDNWTFVAEAGRILEKTAQLLPKTTEVPSGQRDSLAVQAGDLAREAQRLTEAARGKDVKSANEALQRLHLIVRQLTMSK